MSGGGLVVGRYPLLHANRRSSESHRARTFGRVASEVEQSSREGRVSCRKNGALGELIISCSNASSWCLPTMMFLFSIFDALIFGARSVQTRLPFNPSSTRWAPHTRHPLCGRRTAPHRPIPSGTRARASGKYLSYPPNPSGHLHHP